MSLSGRGGARGTLDRNESIPPPRVIRRSPSLTAMLRKTPTLRQLVQFELLAMYPQRSNVFVGKIVQSEFTWQIVDSRNEVVRRSGDRIPIDLPCQKLIEHFEHAGDERQGSAGGRERFTIVKPPESPAPLYFSIIRLRANRVHRAKTATPRFFLPSVLWLECPGVAPSVLRSVRLPSDCSIKKFVDFPGNVTGDPS